MDIQQKKPLSSTARVNSANAQQLRSDFAIITFILAMLLLFIIYR